MNFNFVIFIRKIILVNLMPFLIDTKVHLVSK